VRDRCDDLGVTLGDPLRALLDAAVEGDDVATAELVRRTQADVWRLCTALGSPGEEEDLVQETYLKALRSASAYRGDAPVRSWLLAIARNTCADHVRRRTRQRALIARLAPTRTEPVAAIDGAVADLLDRIDPDRREAFVLTQVLGMSYEEAAATVGCPIGTIRSRVARARADLLVALRASETG
jgi:RNA polymerase sigma-70 factor (ECF subfamily)